MIVHNSTYIYNMYHKIYHMVHNTHATYTGKPYTQLLPCRERKIDVEGSFFDKTVTRPLSITNDNIDILRSKLLAYQTLLIEDQQ